MSSSALRECSAFPDMCMNIMRTGAFTSTCHCCTNAMYDRSSSNAAACTHVCHTAVRRSSIRYIFLQKKIELCHQSAFQQSDHASKYRCLFKCLCQSFFFQDPDPPLPLLPAVRDSRSAPPLCDTQQDRTKQQACHMPKNSDNRPFVAPT